VAGADHLAANDCRTLGFEGLGEMAGIGLVGALFATPAGIRELALEVGERAERRVAGAATVGEDERPEIIRAKGVRPFVDGGVSLEPLKGLLN